MNFRIEKKIKNALGRAAILETAHGLVHTPAFVPVGTKASVKALTPEMVRDLGAEIVLGNTYHLYLQPGDEVVRDAGGIGKFMGWRRSDGTTAPTMTDSGGFQVFSLGAAYGKGVSKVARAQENSRGFTRQNPTGSDTDENFLGALAKVDENGVSFKSHLDGSLHYITPEKSIEIQHNLGADIIFAFDEATSPEESFRYQEEALERTHRWARRSLEYHEQSGKRREQALFGIVQGGLDPELRKRSAKFISSLDFDGFGIGGSYTKEHIAKTTHLVNEILPESKPRHLLGIGEPEDLFVGVANGVDLFDCVAPTRAGRNGTLYTKGGKINIVNAKFVRDFSPPEEDCGCYTCSNFSRAYLAHLFRGKEMLAGTLATVHNLYFIVNLVKRIRESILRDNFFEFQEGFVNMYRTQDI